MVSDCTLAGLRILQENGQSVLHPVEALARAYGLLDEKPAARKKFSPEAEEAAQAD